MNPNSKDFLNIVHHPLQFRAFLWSKLPAAFFSGVRVKTMNEDNCVVTVPYKWFTRNPFRSTYFACLSMAAEMSTGALGILNVYKRKPTVSMLVVKVEGEFHKKSTGIATFICSEGAAIRNCVETAISTGEPQSIKVLSSGINGNNEPIATFYVTWSFKQKSRQSSVD